MAALHDPALALNFCDDLLVLSGGNVRAVLRPAADPLEKMERHLSEVYGSISLHRCTESHRPPTACHAERTGITWMAENPQMRE